MDSRLLRQFWLIGAHHAIICAAPRKSRPIMPSKPILRREVLKAGCGGALAASYVFAPAGLRAQARATVAEDMARWIVALRYEQLPANVVASAKRVLFDTLGCALGGINAAPVRMA